MSSIVRFAGYLAAALFLVWRAETFMDARNGGGDFLPRLMCVVLALLLLMTGFIQALNQNQDGGSEPV